jgi:hypothetical protein
MSEDETYVIEISFSPVEEQQKKDKIRVIL